MKLGKRREVREVVGGTLAGMWRARRLSPTLFLLGALLFVYGRPSCAQQSKPVAHDDNMKASVAANKFLQREATDDSLASPMLDEEALANTQCPQNVELRWQTEVGSSIYATPLISDINGDGQLEIVVPTFVHYLEVLEGSDGEKMTGWPAQHQSTVHASPLVYDIDKDGSKEIALTTFNGEILFYRLGGYLMPDKLVVPRLTMHKDWYVGLDPDHVDRTRPDVHDENLIEDLVNSGSSKKAKNKPVVTDEVSNNVSTSMNDTAHENNTIQNKTSADEGSHIVDSTIVETNKSSGNSTFGQAMPNATEVLQSQVESTTGNEVGMSTGSVNDLVNSLGQSQGDNAQRRLLQAKNSVESTTGDEGEVKENDVDIIPKVEDPDDPMESDAQASFDVFRDEDEDVDHGLTEEYDYDYDDYVNEGMWGDEDWGEIFHKKVKDFIEVDSHILATPVIADIDKDGVFEMVVAASYFYDREYYDSAEHKKELGEDLDLGKYVAGAIVVFNLDTKQVKWVVQLDQSTDSTTYRAYIYSSPTVVDLDGDGFLDIIVGTSMGFLYVIDHTGIIRKGFPLQMGEIQGQVVAADINDDGKIEIVTADSKGTVVVWTPEGTEIWDKHLKSLISQGPSVGDIDGDGHTDLVVPTTSGNIYVLRGSDGSNVGPYPFRTHGRVMSPALLVDLNKPGGEKKGLTIGIGSFDGYFYLIDGPTGCAEAIDIGETSYSMALADNVDGGDDLDIIVTTMNGNVYCFQTPAPHHPLKAWPTQTQGRNVFASRYQREGIFIVPSSRTYRDEAGDSFHVTFEIVDKHLVPSGGTLAPYKVTVTLLTPGNYRGNKTTQYHYTYDHPGVYTLMLPCLPTRTTATVIVEMSDKNSLYFSDEFSLTFHMHYYQLLKWLLTLPLFGTAGMFLVFRPQEAGASLPSFSRERHQL